MSIRAQHQVFPHTGFTQAASPGKFPYTQVKLVMNVKRYRLTTLWAQGQIIYSTVIGLR